MIVKSVNTHDHSCIVNPISQILVSSSLGYGLYQPSNSSYTRLNLLGLVGSGFLQGNGLNDAGQIVGEYSDAKGDEHGFVLTDGILANLDVPGAEYTWAYGINDAGLIVGTFEAADGTYHGFLADPVLEPATNLLIAIGMFGVKFWAC